MSRRDESRWCPLCEVDLGLHGDIDPDDITPDDCEYAARKADILASFFRLFMRAPTGW